MSIEFSLSDKQRELKDSIHALAKSVIRPQSLSWDRSHEIPKPFLGQMGSLAASMGSLGGGTEEMLGQKKKEPDPSKKKQRSMNVSTLIAAEELSWGDGALLISLPGPGLGGPPVLATGTPEQKERFFGIFQNTDEVRWGAYGLTEPGAGSDVAGIRTSCRKEGDDWVLNGRKCYITNGARASWVVIFATVNPELGRAGHRAFVVEHGTPGFSVGKIEDKMGLRASETAELVLEDCRVPDANLLGGEERYVSKEGFMTAMKTFDNTRPIVAAMAIGIGRAAYDYTVEFVKSNYMLSRPVAVYRTLLERLGSIGRDLHTARMMAWKAAWMADRELPNAKEASMSKALGGQAAIRACIEAIEICGAAGTVSDDHALLEKWFRDIKVYDIFEGTGQIQRIVIAKRLIEGLKGF